jgi:hypothetical protein
VKVHGTKRQSLAHAHAQSRRVQGPIKEKEKETEATGTKNKNKKQEDAPNKITREIRQANQQPFWRFGVV